MAIDEKKSELDKVEAPPSRAISRGQSPALAVPQVPKSQRPVLAALLGYDKDRKEALLSCLEEAGPFLIAEGMKDRISKALGVDSAEAEAIKYTLTSIYASHESLGLTSNVILRAIKNDDELRTLTSVEEEGDIVEFFDRLFTLRNSFGVVTNAYRLMREHENNYCTSEVTTDLRPIFDDGAESALAAGVIHNLRISFHKQTSDGDFFVALDSEDLKQVRDQIELALKKDTKLRKLASSIGLPLIKE